MEAAAGIYARLLTPDIVNADTAHLQKAMLDATPDCIKLLSPDGRLLLMNKAGCRALNVVEDSGFGMPWLPLLPADVHTSGMEALRKAATGHSARFPGKSISPGGTLYWDNLLTPIVDASGQVLSILCVSRDVTEKTRLERELEDAISREKLLSRELQHRAKNLFSVVSWLIIMAEKEAEMENAPETVTRILADKLGALSRASDVAYSPQRVAENEGGRIDLESLVNAVLMPYGDRCLARGMNVHLSRDDATNIALFVHELATNAIKYGALGAGGGNVTVHWSAHGERLHMTWTEHGGPSVSLPSRHGSGSEMLDNIVRSAAGAIKRIWRPSGLMVELDLKRSPLE